MFAQPLPGVQGQRPREDARNDAVALAVQPRFDDAGELDVVVAEHARPDDDRDAAAWRAAARFQPAARNANPPARGIVST